jgi:hypothetical protein
MNKDTISQQRHLSPLRGLPTCSEKELGCDNQRYFFSGDIYDQRKARKERLGRFMVSHLQLKICGGATPATPR